jgi:hypothetical protein
MLRPGLMNIALKILMVIVVIISIGVIGYVLLVSPPNITKPAPQNNVFVNGVIKIGFGASPHNITFVSQKTGDVASATINKIGYYSIALLGNDTYNVAIFYNTLFGITTNKNCMGILTLNSIVNATNFSRSC